MNFTNDKRYSLKQIVIFLVLAFSMVTVLSYAAVIIPNTFTSGTAISSSQVNANFDALKTAVDAKQDRPALGSFPTTSAGRVAWAHMNCNVTPTCSIMSSYNSTSGAVNATTYALGIGGVTFTGVDVENASIQVTAGYIYGAPRICYLTAVSVNIVNVRCDNISGSNSAADFYVTVIQ